MKGASAVEYKREIMKKRRNKTRKRLIKLWVECSSFEEFDLKTATDIPDADRMDLFACRLYMFRKNHPFMYSLIWIAVIPALTGCSGAAIEHLIWLTTGHNLVQLGVLAGFLLYVLVFMLHSAYVGTVMHALEWYEREYRIAKEYGINH